MTSLYASVGLELELRQRRFVLGLVVIEMILEWELWGHWVDYSTRHLPQPHRYLL